MLVLSRRVAEQIVVPEFGITLTILDIAMSRVRIGIEAPAEIKVVRRELLERQDAAAADQRSASARKGP